ncbi:hypothetical protein H5410_005373 [Solanum commersonii]|uniref:Uncharacterized protein n=1 Tax=Solanum commersonii TaxID=4109 RepID=A0A9J6A799_SOLCO|nr:hypothetical protein H5410_005373 [Solanum commersonii]
MDDENSVFDFDRSGSFCFVSGSKDKCKEGQKFFIVVVGTILPLATSFRDIMFAAEKTIQSRRKMTLSVAYQLKYNGNFIGCHILGEEFKISSIFNEDVSTLNTKPRV